MKLFDKDCVMSLAAIATGCEVIRRPRIEITDTEKLKRDGFMKESPDFSKIREWIDSGREVAGARITGIDYVFKQSIGVAAQSDRLESIKAKPHGPDVDWMIEEIERLRSLSLSPEFCLKQENVVTGA